MPDLVIVTFESESGADEARASLQDLPEAQVTLIDDAMTLTSDSPELASLAQVRSRTSRLVTWPRAILGSAFAGACLVSAWVIAETGSIGGSLIRGRKQIDHGTVKKLDNKLRDAGSALILVLRESTPDEMMATLTEYDSDVMRTELSKDSLKKLRKVLQSD
jgi:uncharacterized membrane protein